jgi:hypothetical protein
MNINRIITEWVDDVRASANRYFGVVPFSVRVAAILFAGKRSDYYRYLADLIEGTQGKKGIREIFVADSERYGMTSRGKLSQHWITAFDKNGGKFIKTFAGTLPDDEVKLLHILQARGGKGVLEEGLKELADTTALTQRATNIILGATAAMAIPVGLVVGMCAAMPLFTVPEIKSGFSMVPPALYPDKAIELFALSDFIANNGLLLVVLLIALFAFVAWSLPRLKGRTRLYFDKYLIVWGIYRDFQSIKFISNLSLVLKNRNNESSRLRKSLEDQKLGASPWKIAILDQMLDKMDKGKKVEEVFKVGLFDQSMQYDLEDLILSRGLDDALIFLRPRLEQRVVVKLQRRATLLKVLMLGGSAILGTYLLILHSLATSSLQQAMQFTLH